MFTDTYVVFAKRGTKVNFSEYFIRRAVTDRNSFEKKNLVRTTGIMKVVGREYDCAAIFHLFVNHLKNGIARNNIKTSYRFI